MGHKINANGLRVGVNKTWNSIWFAKGKQYVDNLHQDLLIKKIVTEKMHMAGLANVVVRRSDNNIEVEVSVARPGVAIGRGGSAFEALKDYLSKKTKSNVSVKLHEVKKADLSARVIARTIADGIEKRMLVKPLMETAKSKVMLAGAKGVRIVISGRINNASQARVVKTSEGRLPLQVMKANIDYAEERAATKDLGIMGVKVWVYNPSKE